MKSILDPTFRYVPSTHTNIRETFARARAEQQAASTPAPAEHFADSPYWIDRRGDVVREQQP